MSLNKYKKIIYAVLFTLLVLWTLFLYSKTNLNKKNTYFQETVPLSTESSKISTSNKNIKTDQIESLPNLTLTESGNYYIEDRGLTLNSSDGIKSLVDTKNEPVVDFKINQGSILIKTGDVYGNNHKYFISKLGSNNSTEIDISKSKPINTISASPDGDTAFVLGNFDIKKYSSNLYTYDPKTKQNLLVSSGTNKNDILALNSTLVVLGKEIDKPEPNYFFDILDTDSKRLLIKDIQSSKNLLCNNQDFLIYYDYQSKNIRLFDFKKNTNQSIISVFPSDTRNKIICNSNNFYTISEKNNVLNISQFLISNGNLVNEFKSQIGTGELYVDIFAKNDGLVTKTRNEKSGSFSLKKIP